MWRIWLALLRPGDYVLLAISTLAVAWSFPTFWQGGLADRVVIRQEGKLFAEHDLRHATTVVVPGPLGITKIEIEPGRARVASDPGLRQYCVRQGWLRLPGEIAICAPNRVSVQIKGRTQAYDSLSY